MSMLSTLRQVYERKITTFVRKFCRQALSQMGFLNEICSEMAIASVVEMDINFSAVFDFFKAYNMVRRTLFDKFLTATLPKTTPDMTTFLLAPTPAVTDNDETARPFSYGEGELKEVALAQNYSAYFLTSSSDAWRFSARRWTVR